MYQDTNVKRITTEEQRLRTAFCNFLDSEAERNGVGLQQFRRQIVQVPLLSNLRLFTLCSYHGRVFAFGFRCCADSNGGIFGSICNGYFLNGAHSTFSEHLGVSRDLNTDRKQQAEAVDPHSLAKDGKSRQIW